MSPMDTILIESTYFENYKSKGYDDFITALKIADDKIIDYIEKTKGVWTKAKQNELRKYINDEIITSYGGLFETIPNEAVESATIAYGAMIGSVKPELPKEAIKAIIDPKREIQGRTLNDLFKLDGENHARKLSIEVASSVARGIPVDKLMRELDMTVSKRELGQVDNRIIATKKLIKNATDETKIKDLNSDLDNLQYQRNVLAVDNRYKQYAKQNIRTLISESRADGRYVAFREMEDMGTVKGYEYCAVLDFSTTPYCSNHDGNIYYKKIDEIRHLVKTHYQCLTKDSLIESNSQINIMFRRLFKGNIYTITTAKGNTITCTPNHPILGVNGFVSANMFNKGDKIATNNTNVTLVGNMNNNQGITTVENLFSSFAKTGKMISMKVPHSTENFHGDIGIDKNVDIVFTDSFLSNGRKPVSDYMLVDNGFNRRHSDVLISFYSNTSFYTVLNSFRNTFRGFMTRLNLIFSSFFIHKRPLSNFLLRSCSEFNTLSLKLRHKFSDWNIKSFFDSFESDTVSIKSDSTLKSKNSIIPLSEVIGNPISLLNDSRDSIMTDSELNTNILNGSFGDKVFFDDIVDITITKNSSCHVYNLENDLNYYTTNNIINHNCRSDFVFFNKNQRSATRASILGQTANVSYKEWFKAIPDDVKQRVLTKKQYSLWKKNQYPVNSLADITRTQTMNTITDNMNNLIED